MTKASPTKSQLPKDDWIAAGFRALAKAGPSAVRINHLAPMLKATKGSFYWHFKNIDEFKSEMLKLWQERVAGEVIEDVNQAPSYDMQVARFMQQAMREAPEEYGGRRVETAIRAWSLVDEDVARALQKVDQERIAFIKAMIAQSGYPQPSPLAEICYAAYIGLDDLDGKDHIRIEEAMPVLFALIAGQAPQAGTD